MFVTTIKPSTMLLVGILIGILCSHVYFKTIDGYKKLDYTLRSSDKPCENRKATSLDEARSVLLLSQTNISDEMLYKSIVAVQKERKYIKEKACIVLTESAKTLLIQASTYYPARDFHSTNYNLSVCHIQKCGYTSWYNAVLVMEDYFSVDDFLSGKIFGDNVTDFAKEHITLGAIEDKRVARQFWEKSYKVILVRHPFSRLVSAYYDKLVPTSKGFTSFYKRISKAINKNYKNLRHKIEDRNITDDGCATFEDFVNYILFDRFPIDEHWKPFYMICNPCLSNYNYIAKFETLSNDMKYLRDRLNISDYHRKAFFPNKHFESSMQKTNLEFKKIPHAIALMLYDRFKPDFELFGYDRPSWLN